MSTLEQGAQNFVAHYMKNTKLSSEQSDWSCRVLLQTIDQTAHIVVQQGRAEVKVCDTHDLVVSASLQVLLDVLALRLHPNQPYLFGELTVQGQESDFMRVDYIVSRLMA